jgi:serine/threonine protein kinase
MAAEFFKFSEFRGPGEQLACETLVSELSSDYVVVSGRSLDTSKSEDIDIWVLGMNNLFVIDEKYWGPHITMGDTKWTVRNEHGKESERKNPLGGIAHKARVAKGWLEMKINAFSNVKDRRVHELILLTYSDVFLDYEIGRSIDERVKKISEVSSYIIDFESQRPSSDFRAHRESVKRLLIDEKSRLSNPLPVFQDQNLKVLRRLNQHNDDGSPRKVEAFEAEDQNFGDIFHLRCFVKHQFVSNDSQADAFFRRELNASRALQATGRAWVYRDYFEDEKRNYLVFKFEKPPGVISISDLSQSDDNNLISIYLEQMLRIVFDAFSAMNQIHETKIVHRTLCPQRIWISPSMNISFSDFDAAAMHDEETISAIIDDHESEPYRAPEASLELGSSTYASDVYSLASSLKVWIEKCKSNLDLYERAESKEQLDQLKVILDSCLHNNQESRPNSQEIMNRVYQLDPKQFEEFRDKFGGSDSKDLPDDENDIFIKHFKGRYVKIGTLGSGGSSVTYRARRKDGVGDSSERVIKHARTEADFERLKKEYRVLDEIKGAAFSTAKELIEDPSPGVLILSYIPGITLKEFFRDELAPAQILDMFEQASKQIDVVHQHGWVHGDIQPQNLIINDLPELTVSLIDFGSAVKIGDSQRQPRTLKTCAPEMLIDAAKTAKTDVYSLAATFLNLILKRPHRKLHASDFNESYELLTLTDLDEAKFSEEMIGFIRILFECVNFEADKRPSIQELQRKVVELLSTRNYVLEAGLIEKINPTVDLTRSLYLTGALASDMAIAERAEGVENLAAFMKHTYVETKLDTNLLPEILEARAQVFLLTGNPGGGKTSFINRVRDELKKDLQSKEIFLNSSEWCIESKGREYFAVLDGSASNKGRSANQVVRDALLRAKQQSAVAIIAINDGRTREFFREVEDDVDFFEWAQLVNEYFDSGKDNGSGLRIIDLKSRTYTTFEGDGILEKTIKKLAHNEQWEDCSGCSCRKMCPIFANRNKLTSSQTVAQISKFMTMNQLRGGKRPNMRQVRSAIAFMVTGDKSCSDIHELSKSTTSSDVLNNLQLERLLFEQETEDDLILGIRELDPALQISPTLRQRIVSESVVARSREHFSRRYKDLSREISLGVEQDPDSEILGDLQLYKYGQIFTEYLKAERDSLEPLLLGLSRVSGNQLKYQNGLAITESTEESGWNFAKVIPTTSFSLHVGVQNSEFLETIPESLILVHNDTKLQFSINLELFELILRCCNGEVFLDSSSAALRLSILTFQRKLLRTPLSEILAISSDGDTSKIKLRENSIVLQTKDYSHDV